MSDKKFTAWFSGVTEFERGWGNRPDGYLVAKNLPSFRARAAQIDAQQGDEFSRVNGEARACYVTEEMHKKLLASPTLTVWTGRETSWHLGDRDPV